LNMKEIYIRASDETIEEILKLVKRKDWGKDVKIVDLCPDYIEKE